MYITLFSNMEVLKGMSPYIRTKFRMRGAVV